MALPSLRRQGLCVIICVVLAGCGQRGPLTLPDESDSTGTLAAGNEAATEELPSDATDSEDQ